MTIVLALWFALSVLCDVSGQLCLKIGADRLPERMGRDVVFVLLRQPWIVSGVMIYIVEIFVWLRILTEAPLSLAFPIASLNFLGITWASRVFLKEAVGPRQWLGSLLIMLGVLVVARSA